MFYHLQNINATLDFSTQLKGMDVHWVLIAITAWLTSLLLMQQVVSHSNTAASIKRKEATHNTVHDSEERAENIKKQQPTAFLWQIIICT